MSLRWSLKVRVPVEAYDAFDVPPQAPRLGTRVARAFADSVESLQRFGEWVLIACVSIAPWLPISIVGIAISIVVLGRLMARSARITLIDITPAPTDRV